MNVWLSPICLSSVNTSECVCVCMWGDCVKRRVLGGQPGGAPCHWRGWMDECEHLFHAPFTATGMIHLSETLLSSRLSDVHSNPSHWWIIPSPPPPPSSRFLENAQKGLTRACRGTQMCICQREWTSGFICNCILHWDKWCFSKTSAEKQVQKCGLTLLVAHYKWFLSAGGVPSSPCHLLFSPTNCLFCCFYLSPSFKRALTHTQLPSHFVSLCFNPVKDRNRCERGSHLYALSSADQCWNPPGFLCSVCRVCCLPCCTYIGHDFDRIRWDSRGKGRPIRVARVTSLFPWEASSR